ncbi:UvrD/REP helicase family protein (macronuclear) [Tetrahymena thermophila SB210]|uniref:DNA 3'-5' helicase n=1 Tax=Tetrahymena thermophila (strain SB210) TaxID=312017 RepID=I7LUV1_TETTS|nr:UvrD/REP helicase family protein [Tetrahymena thermophila SB210]EAR96100.2 UvrD/REP helicase family protein [Tetrahymena thermophila SB210]|eukprot:XP_001016345.2 UvrD/REP helicase family protein [Tetrahymena thermophila SB210]
MEQKVSDNNSFQQNIALTDEQQKIIYSNIDEDQRILACAGSGKTTTLIYRIEYLIKQGIPASQILLSTFNVEAANNLKIKAKQVLHQDEVEEKNIMNIDKFTADIYKNYIKDNDKNFKLDVKEFGYKVKNYLSTIEGEQKVLKQYKYFFFDEFQDVNQIQYDILILFKKAGCKIIVIGDEAQNIYSFRDTKLEFIQSKINQDILKISQQEIKTYHLSINFRCSSKITKFCNQIFANTQHFAKPMQSLKEADQVKFYPKIRLYKNSDELVNDIIIQLQNLINIYQWSDLAILSPTRKPLIHFQEILEKHNSTLQQIIPYSLRFRDMNNVFTCDNSDATEEQKNLTLSTIHASKGLEWKVVFIIGINDSNFPGVFINYLQEENEIQEKLSECRRLFYVACTRAKEQLSFSFIKQKGKYICRFFSEINEEQYECQDTNFKREHIAQIQSKKSNFKPLNIKNNIADIIQNFDFNDYEVVNSFLQKIQLVNKETGKEATYNSQKIRQNALQQDLICYLDILLYRCVTEKYLQSQKILNEDAEKILCTINWKGKSKVVYNKFIEFFNKKSLIDLEILNSQEQFINCLNNHYSNKQQFDQNEIKILQEMRTQIKSFLEKNKLKYEDICHATESHSLDYFPEDFMDKQKYVDSYLKFSDKTQKTENIIKDVYNVSKCHLISQGIRRSLYRDDIELLQPWNLKLNINRFLKSLNLKYDKNRFEIKKKVEYDSLNGVIDLIAFDKDKGDIIQFIYHQGKSKLSISKEQIIQSLVYAYILKKKSYSIKNIVFYNVLNEDLITYSIDQWNQEEEFLRFLQKKKEDYQKEQEETDDNLEEEEDQQELEIQENTLQNLYTSIEEEQEDEKEEKENNSKKINNYNLQESQQVQKNQLPYQFNNLYSRSSTQNLSQNSVQTVQENNLQCKYNQNDQEDNVEIENQLIYGNQSDQNENLIQKALDNQKINQNEPLENQNNLVSNIQQNRDNSKKIEEPCQLLFNLKNHEDENSQIENKMSNLNSKRKREKNQVEYEQQKINLKKQKVELKEKAINVQIIFFIIYILIQVFQTSLQYKVIIFNKQIFNLILFNVNQRQQTHEESKNVAKNTNQKPKLFFSLIKLVNIFLCQINVLILIFYDLSAYCKINIQISILKFKSCASPSIENFLYLNLISIYFLQNRLNYIVTLQKIQYFSFKVKIILILIVNFKKLTVYLRFKNMKLFAQLNIIFLWKKKDSCLSQSFIPYPHILFNTFFNRILFKKCILNLQNVIEIE